MVVGALNSKNRIFHYPECIYAKKIGKSNLIEFALKSDARACGYRQCVHCSRLPKYYEKDKDKIDKALREGHMKMYIEDDSMYIDHDFSCWKITTSDTGYDLVLFHGNTESYNRLKVKNGHIQHHYHHQNYRGRADILSMIQYIIEHDEWKSTHSDNYKKLPRSTKKQRKEYNRQKRIAKKNKMTNLYNTIYRVSLEEKQNKKRG